MKKILIASLLLPLLSAQVLKQGERDRAMSELHASRKQLIDATSNLSPAQLSFKASDDKWSIAEVVEHLATTEPFLFNFYQQVAKGPADPAKKSAQSDEELLKSIRSRSEKVSAPEPLKPVKAFASTAAAIEAYKASRDKTIVFVETTQDTGLRNKIVPNFGMDAYQIFLLLASHTQRHVEQINEVKAAPGFPAK